MKKIFNYIIIFAATLALGSCKKDLEVTNPNTATVSVFWKTAADAKLGVNAVYSTFHRGAISRWQIFANMVRSDEGFSTSPDANLQNNYDRFIITDNAYGNNTGIWSDNYIGIFRANQVLENVPNIEIDALTKATYIAEAKFLRSVFYYNLAMLFGNVPLQLRTSTTSDVSIGTSSRDQVWAQVVKDLTESINDLPVTAADPGRATKGAAYGMLAKAYMQQRKFNEALPALQWLVEGPGASKYNLVSNYRDNFIEGSTENNAESVFEIQYVTNPLDTHDNDEDQNAVDNLNTGTSLPKFLAPKPIGFADGEARRWVVREFLKENTTTNVRDPRLATSFLYDSTDVRGPQFSIVFGQTFASLYPGSQAVFFRKFLEDATGNIATFHSGNNYRYIRYADVLLMYAECLNETGNTAKAYQYVDRVRQRAGLATLTSAMPGLNHDSFLAQLKHERITELAGEGHRWDDLMRWNDLGPGLSSRDVGFANFVKGKHELLPIPRQDVDLNPNIKQNPGY
jgi:hypothetical protein